MSSPAPGETAGHPLRPLPIRPRPAAGESPGSYVRRLALANHLRPGYLHRYLQDPGQPGRIGLDWLAVLAGRTPAALQRALTGDASGRPAEPKPSKATLFTGIRRDAARGRLSIRSLADRHGVHRRVVRQALQAPTPPPRKTPSRRSRLDPYKSVIEGILDAERSKRPQDRLSITAIYEQLVTQHGATGVSYRTVHRHIAGRRQDPPPGLPGELIKNGDAIPADHDCPFCDIAAGGSDSDLIVLRTSRVLTIPALNQQPAHPGQIVVLPSDHVTVLHEASPDLLAELFSTAARVTAVMPAAFGASGSTIVQDNLAADPAGHHLHVHVVPRFTGQEAAIPASEPASRSLRTAIAQRLRQAMH